MGPGATFALVCDAYRGPMPLDDCPQPQGNRQFPSAQSSHAAVAANETRRRLKHGRLRPMHEPTLIERLLGR